MRTKAKFQAVRAAAVVVFAAAGWTAVSANDPTGVWLRDNGDSKIRFAPCGAALCGTIVWLKKPDGPSKVGQRVFFDLVRAGDNEWRGKAFNPEDGRSYSGKVTVNGNALSTAGCALGGLVCRSVGWVKAE